LFKHDFVLFIDNILFDIVDEDTRDDARRWSTIWGKLKSLNGLCFYLLLIDMLYRSLFDSYWYC